MNDRPPDNKSAWVRYGGIGIEFAAALGCFALVGLWVDRRYGTGPWGLVIGAMLGLIGGTYNLIRESLAAFRGFEPGARRKKDADKHD
jgi:F0F1-type ATP synthase assembly protein I